MLSETLGLFPKSAALAALIYLAIAWLLGNTFSERLAEWRHIPACVAGLEAKEAAARHGLPSEQEIAKGVLRGILKYYPELRDIPGVGELDRSMDGLAARNQGAGRRARCACLAALARKESGIDYMLWVATLKVYEPDGVRNFLGVMSRLDHQGACGRGG